MHLGPQHLHAFHIRVLTFHIRSPHEHLALHVHQRTHRGRSHAVLSGACLGDDACLAHLLSQQYLSDGVVDFVGSRVVEVLALEIQLTAILLAHATCEIQRRRPSHIILQQCVVLLLERCCLDNPQVLASQILYCGIENFGDISAAELSVKTIFIYLITLFHIV